MAATHTRIIVADLPSPWRTALIEGLEAVEPAIRVTEFGHELRRALEEVVVPPRIIIVGPALKGIGGLEALFQADRTLVLERKSRPKWPARSVSLITDVRSDAELLDLLRRRGVTQFIYRDDPVERTVTALLSNLQPTARAMVRLDAVLTAGGVCAPGAVYDLSTGGAQLILQAQALPQALPVGEQVEVAIGAGTQRLECQAEVRRLSLRSSTTGQRLVIGLQFVDLSPEISSRVDLMVREAAEEFEMARDVLP